MHLLMTRPRAASEKFVAMLSPKRLAKVRVIHSPLLDIRPLVSQIDLEDAQGIIFTSANGVTVGSRLIPDRTLPCFCVGQYTTETAKQAGWTAEFVGLNAESLIVRLLELRPESPLLHIHGTSTRGDVSETLTQLGLLTRSCTVYEQKLLDLTGEALDALRHPGQVIAPFFSPRTARQFAGQSPGAAPLWLAAMSEAVAEPLKALDFERLRVAKQPNAQSMQRAVEKLIKRASRVEGDPNAH